MDVKSTAVSELRRAWRWSLPTGLFTPLVSLMLGTLLQTVFYEIAQAIPSVYRQDAHISLPACNLFPGLAGCEPGVGALTGLQIWELSQQVGQISGLLINVLLVSIASLWVSVRLRSDHPLPGLLTGATAGLSSLALALALSVPINLHSARGLSRILMIAVLPLSGIAGAKIGKGRLARGMSRGSLHFIPGEAARPMDWVGESLSQRELEVLALVAEGLKNRQIAQRLYISQATVKTHLIHIYTKLEVDSRTAAVTKALAIGWLCQAEQPGKST